MGNGLIGGAGGSCLRLSRSGSDFPCTACSVRCSHRPSAKDVVTSQVTLRFGSSSHRLNSLRRRWTMLHDWLRVSYIVPVCCVNGGIQTIDVASMFGDAARNSLRTSSDQSDSESRIRSE